MSLVPVVLVLTQWTFYWMCLPIEIMLNFSVSFWKRNQSRMEARLPNHRVFEALAGTDVTIAEDEPFLETGFI